MTERARRPRQARRCTPWSAVRALRAFALAAIASTAIAAQSAHPVLGRISFPTSGSPAAQTSFLRGVLLLHSFEYDEAITAFREAERLDPGFAMAYWGEAMCYNQTLWYNEQVGKARAALSRLGPTPAARAAKAGTERERAYLDAVERLVGDGDKPSRDRAYANRMQALTVAYPTDDEAGAFYALALLGTIPDGRPRPDVSLKAGTIASAILKRNPEHPGAAHYALHAYDDGEHAALGLEAARIYAKIAPASSHARHMPSHIFLPLGLWDEAAASDESAFAASVESAKRRGLSAAQYDFHSLSWLQYEYLQQGRFAKAQQLLQPVEEALRDASAGGASAHQHGESQIGRGFDPTALKSERASMRARMVVESGDWTAMQGRASFDNLDELFALGLSSVHLHDLDRADAAIEHLHTAAKTIPDRDARAVAEIMAIAVDGSARLARHDRAGGLAALARASALDAARPRPVARPYPIKPAGELYAEALLAEGDAPAALKAFQAALARTPNRAAALLGLMRSARAAGSPAQAASAARKFISIWHAADAGRPELAEARRLTNISALNSREFGRSLAAR
jgi:tetratricopeptide (TPR) repeat protein